MISFSIVFVFWAYISLLFLLNQSFGDHVIRIVTPHDKKTILFYNDKSFDLNVDEGRCKWTAYVLL